MGRLCGAEERVLERVVTYLVSAMEHGNDLCGHALFPTNTEVVHKDTKTVFV